MRYKIKRNVLTACIATVWLINGLFCKVLNLVPRHREIVATILGGTHAREWTIIIGLAEIAMAAWIISGCKRRLNAVIQMLVIGAMNMLEFKLAPGLLLWGNWNAFFALLFILLIFYNGFHHAGETDKKTPDA